MSIYCYTDGTDVVEREFPIGSAPQTITVEGKRWKRSYRDEAAGFIPPEGAPGKKDRQFIVRSMEPFAPEFENHITDKSHREYGAPVINSPREIREATAKVRDRGGSWENFTYDGSIGRGKNG